MTLVGPSGCGTSSLLCNIAVPLAMRRLSAAQRLPLIGRILECQGR